MIRRRPVRSRACSTSSGFTASGWDGASTRRTIPMSIGRPTSTEAGRRGSAARSIDVARSAAVRTHARSHPVRPRRRAVAQTLPPLCPDRNERAGVPNAVVPWPRGRRRATTFAGVTAVHRSPTAGAMLARGQLLRDAAYSFTHDASARRFLRRPTLETDDLPVRTDRQDVNPTSRPGERPIARTVTFGTLMCVPPSSEAQPDPRACIRRLAHGARGHTRRR